MLKGMLRFHDVYYDACKLWSICGVVAWNMWRQPTLLNFGYGTKLERSTDIPIYPVPSHSHSIALTPKAFMIKCICNTSKKCKTKKHARQARLVPLACTLFHPETTQFCGPSGPSIRSERPKRGARSYIRGELLHCSASRKVKHVSTNSFSTILLTSILLSTSLLHLEAFHLCP